MRKKDSNIKMQNFSTQIQDTMLKTATNFQVSKKIQRWKIMENINHIVTIINTTHY